MKELDVVKKYKIWEDTIPSEELCNSSLSFLKSQQLYLKSRWIGLDEDTAYVQTYDKIESYIRILSGEDSDHTLIMKKLTEVESRVFGLFQNWRETPDDNCIPPILENYVYVRCLLEQKADFAFRQIDK